MESNDASNIFASESRIYDTLSTLVTKLKKLLFLLERTHSLQSKKFDTEDILKDISEILNEFDCQLPYPTPVEYRNTF